MKFLPAQFSYFVETSADKRNVRLLARFLAVLAGMIVLYSVLFHVIMEAEGQQHSWLTGLYWTLTVMSTLGFGDITFQTDLGRAFSIVVLVSGVLFLLIVLPFTFIQFFYAPWLEAQTRRRVPRAIDEDTHGHLLLTSFDPIAVSLIERLTALRRPYFIVEPDLSKALEMEEQGLNVVLGAVDDIATYRNLGLDRAAMVVANVNDQVNTNVAFTVRELDQDVSVVSFARDPDSVDVLELAGSTKVLHMTHMLGESLARRVLAGDHRTSVIGQFDELVVAEAPIAGTPLVGKTLGDGWLRAMTGLTAVGAWTRGSFAVPGPGTRLHPSTVLLLAGTEDQLTQFRELTAIYRATDDPVLILGGGRVGRAAGADLEARGIAYRILEKDPERARGRMHTMVGNAADLKSMESAGLYEAPTVIVTTSDDATNIYLTIYCRRLRPDVQIVSRATLERNVTTLHRAGADFVMSYASMGASAIINILDGGDVVMVAEGLDLLRVEVPPSLAGVTLAASGIRKETGCHVVAIQTGETMLTSPGPDAVLPSGPDGEMILVATTDAERRFMARYGSTRL